MHGQARAMYGPDVVAVQTPSAGGSAVDMPGSAITQVDNTYDHGILMGFLILGIAYLVWAYVAQHERVRDAVRPATIQVNLWNLLVITLTVVFGLNLFKIIFAKLAAWNVPGAHSIAVLIAGV